MLKSANVVVSTLSSSISLSSMLCSSSIWFGCLRRKRVVLTFLLFNTGRRPFFFFFLFLKIRKYEFYIRNKQLILCTTTPPSLLHGQLCTVGKNQEKVSAETGSTEFQVYSGHCWLMFMYFRFPEVVTVYKH